MASERVVISGLLEPSERVAGDVFDFMYEENMMNMRLLEAHRDRRRPPRTPKAIALTLFLIVAFVFVLAVSAVVGVIFLAFYLIGQRQPF